MARAEARLSGLLAAGSAPGRAPLVVSIQSQMVHGSVGNSAAVFPMQMLGVTVAAVPTVLLSNHPRYPTMRGRALDSSLVADLLLGVEERGLVDEASIILTGYLGSPETGAVVANFIARAKARNPKILYLCDPVIGDDEPGVFVAAGLIDIFRDRLLPLAAIVTPNQFEIEILAGFSARDIASLQRAENYLSSRGPDHVVVTGCGLDDAPKGEIETIVFERGALTRIASERLDIKPNGAGDLFAGLLAARIALGFHLTAASEAAAAGVLAVLRRTLADGSYELRISRDDILP